MDKIAFPLRSPFPVGRTPGLLLLAGIIITMLLFGLILREAISAHNSYVSIQRDEVALNQLQTELTRLDEELSLTAMLAVSTGDSVWQARYILSETLLNDAIFRAAMVLDTSRSGTELDQIRRAHFQRMATEKQAIASAHQGDKKTAQDILQSEEYLHRKQAYMESIELALLVLNDREEFNALSFNRQLSLSVIFAGGVLFISWVIILLLLRANFNRHKQAATERESLIQELEAKNRELESFTYTISHDLKSPLITIQGFLRIVERDSLAGKHDQVSVNVKRITDAAVRMEQLLSDLLKLSRAGHMAIQPVRIPLGDLAREAVELVTGRIMQRNVTVEIHDNLPVVFGDRSRLLEVILNLVDNAIKFMGEQTAPRVIIGARRIGHETVYFVGDNGIGIDPCHHTQILNLFEKLNADSEGTGVGLALVKRIVEQHRGKVWVESEGLGRGSTFCFTLGEI